MDLRKKDDMKVQKTAANKRRKNRMNSVPRFKEEDDLEKYVEILDSGLLRYEIAQEEWVEYLYKKMSGDFKAVVADL